jgi:hypothetical protein
MCITVPFGVFGSRGSPTAIRSGGRAAVLPRVKLVGANSGNVGYIAGTSLPILASHLLSEKEMHMAKTIEGRPQVSTLGKWTASLALICEDLPLGTMISETDIARQRDKVREAWWANLFIANSGNLFPNLEWSGRSGWRIVFGRPSSNHQSICVCDFPGE